MPANGAVHQPPCFGCQGCVANAAKRVFAGGLHVPAPERPPTPDLIAIQIRDLLRICNGWTDPFLRRRLQSPPLVDLGIESGSNLVLIRLARVTDAVGMQAVAQQ